jgi:hypothetical protein
MATKEQELTPQASVELSPEERKIVRLLERDLGRKLTEQEQNLALQQARDIGDL